MNSAAAGIYPFWFWNGDIAEDEISWQIAEMADKGIRGFFIHPRPGLAQPYLSERYFDLVGHAIGEAERHGLVVHLYDEYPFPSGNAGGLTTLGNPQFFSTRLEHRTFDTPGGHVRLELPQGKILSCQAFPVASGVVDWEQGIDLTLHTGPVLTLHSYHEWGLHQYNKKRNFAEKPVPVLEAELPNGEHRVFATAQVTVDDFKYWGNLFDPMNPDAVAEFIRVTHERYYRRFGDKFGTVIPSIFVDETAPGWADFVPAKFHAKYGYELAPLFPAFLDESHPDHERVSVDLSSLLYECFVESFEKPIQAWCREHGIHYIGEKPNIRLSQLQFMDILGCEPGHTKAGAASDLMQSKIRSNTRAVASAAYFYGKSGSVCECYHSMGWSAALQDARLIADGLLFMGIDHVVPHGFYYQTHGLVKHDAPPSFFFQMPYWPLFGALSQRIARIAAAFAGTWIDASVLIVDPNGFFPSRAQLEAYQSMLWRLVETHHDFLIVDTDILSSAAVTEGAITIREIAADVLIVPPARRIEPELLGLLAGFEESGVSVLRPQSAGELSDALAGQEGQMGERREIRVKSGDDSAIHVVNRTDGSTTFTLCINQSSERHDLLIDSDAPLSEVPLDDALPAMLARSGEGYRRTLRPFESVLLKDSGEPEMPPPLETLSVPMDVSVTPLRPNLVRIDNWAFRLASESAAEDAPTVRSMPIIDQLDMARIEFVPNYERLMRHSSRLHQPEVTVVYTAEFESSYEGAVELLIEPNAIVGDWVITVNGARTINPSDFVATDSFVRGCLGTSITRVVRPGTNAIEIELTTNRPDGGVLNPVYLAGDFGVEPSPLRLVNRASHGRFEAWTENGLPYYSGIVQYECSLHIDDPPAADPSDHRLFELVFPTPFEEACSIQVNGNAWHDSLWSPRIVSIPRDELCSGENRVTIRVYTSLIRAFDGANWDIEAHATVPVVRE